MPSRYAALPKAGARRSADNAPGPRSAPFCSIRGRSILFSQDGYVLATLLGDSRTTLSTIDRALRAYDAVRRPFAQRVAATSRENGLLYTLNFPGLTFDRPVARADREDLARLAEIRSRVETNWQWAWTTTIDGDVSRALRMLDGPTANRRRS